MRDRIRTVDGVLSVSEYYADVMAERLSLDRRSIGVVPIGIDTASYPAAPLDSSPPVIGYMARMSELKIQHQR